LVLKSGLTLDLHLSLGLGRDLYISRRDQLGLDLSGSRLGVGWTF